MADTDTRDEKMSAYIVRGFMAFCSLILVGLVGWIGLNVADIPVIKAQMTNLAADLTNQGHWNSQRIEDHETRIRKLEDGGHRP